MKAIKTTLIVFCTLLLNACLKEELPVKPYDRGNVITQQVCIGNDYSQQIWFKLSTNQTVKSNSKLSWDLAFSCNDSNIVLLNTALVAQAAQTNTTDFYAVNSDAGLTYKIDHPGGIDDSLALTNFTNGNVFIIDRGYTPAGIPIGKKKIQLLYVNNSEYKIKYADLNNANEFEYTLVKNNNYHYIYFSLSTNQLLFIEPEKHTWDICFTSYTHVFYNPYTPYLVTGALINANSTSAIKIFNKPFEEISLNDTINAVFSHQRDIIGYDWKTYNFNTSSFQVDFTKNYLIKDYEGFYYKLRFIDFYDNQGNKGCPKFEFKKL